MAKGPGTHKCPKCGDMISKILKVHKTRQNGTACGWELEIPEYITNGCAESVEQLIEAAHKHPNGLTGLKWGIQSVYLEKYPKIIGGAKIAVSSMNIDDLLAQIGQRDDGKEILKRLRAGK